MGNIACKLCGWTGGCDELKGEAVRGDGFVEYCWVCPGCGHVQRRGEETFEEVRHEGERA